jgi:hypothetical protein
LVVLVEPVGGVGGASWWCWWSQLVVLVEPVVVRCKGNSSQGTRTERYQCSFLTRTLYTITVL